MAVPKKKTSRSKSRMRKGSNGSYDANFPNVTTDQDGEFVLSHHISADGKYKGRQVVVKKVKQTAEE